ncbi:MAG TPA: DUF3108 domain-containing protein [Burkholderiaceae bacterium]|jgi:hypothetical protein
MGLKRWAPALLALPVLLAHLGVGGLIHRWDAGWRAEAALPPRIEVAFVRELKQALLKPNAALAGQPQAAGLARFGPSTAPDLWSLPTLDVPPPPEAQPKPVVEKTEGEPGPEWPLSTRLDYLLSGNYRGPVTGSASVEWLRQGSHYQVRLVLSIGGLITRSMVSDGVLTAHGIEPRRYDEETNVLLMAPRHAAMVFDGQQLRFANGSQRPQPIGVQDSASQFVHLTWLFLTGRKPMQVGTTIDLPLALPRKLYDWRYEVLGQEAVETKMGPLLAWHLRPARGEAAIMNGDLLADVWLAPTLQYLPVRILIRQDPQTFIDLTLAKPPLQAADPAAAPAADPAAPQSAPEHSHQE